VPVGNTADAARINFWSNLLSGPCTTCNYSESGGFAVLGPDNCYLPGTTMWFAGTFIASATGVPQRISAPIILKDLEGCTDNKVTLSIYTDACYPTGQQHAGGTPASIVQGSSTVFSEAMTDASHAGLGGDLLVVVDPCTGCNYDSNAGGFDVRGPENCAAPGRTAWLAVPFVAAKSGVPKRISASIILHDPVSCPENKVPLSLYTDDCGLGREHR
jgi:hypothetical protein